MLTPLLDRRRRAGGGKAGRRRERRGGSRSGMVRCGDGGAVNVALHGRTNCNSDT